MTSTAKSATATMLTSRPTAGVVLLRIRNPPVNALSHH
jgi:hypothetical protein